VEAVSGSYSCGESCAKVNSSAHVAAVVGCVAAARNVRLCGSIAQAQVEVARRPGETAV